MHIAIYYKGPLNQLFVLECANRHRNIVNGAESFAMSRKRMMKSAADIESMRSRSALRAANTVPQ